MRERKFVCKCSRAPLGEIHSERSLSDYSRIKIITNQKHGETVKMAGKHVSKTGIGANAKIMRHNQLDLR